MTFIITYTGRQFELLAPTPLMVDLHDIAHALSLICRFNGHTQHHYSVAQHSVLVSRNVPPHLRLDALLHDAAEAYVGDVTSPLKRALGEAYKQIEARVEWAIADHFVVNRRMPTEVKLADLRALATERRDLLADHPSEWPMLQGIEPFEDSVERMSSAQAELEFIWEFQLIMSEAGR